jgi:hypothetical protein
MDRDVKLRSDESTARAVPKSPLPELPVMEGLFPFAVISAENRGLFVLVLFLELIVDAASLGGMLGAGAVRYECNTGGAVGSDGYVTGFTVQWARKCSPKTELYGFTTLPCCVAFEMSNLGFGKYPRREKVPVNSRQT